MDSFRERRRSPLRELAPLLSVFPHNCICRCFRPQSATVANSHNPSNPNFWVTICHRWSYSCFNIENEMSMTWFGRHHPVPYLVTQQLIIKSSTSCLFLFRKVGSEPPLWLIFVLSHPTLYDVICRHSPLETGTCYFCRQGRLYRPWTCLPRTYDATLACWSFACKEGDDGKPREPLCRKCRMVGLLRRTHPSLLSSRYELRRFVASSVTTEPAGFLSTFSEAEVVFFFG